PESQLPIIAAAARLVFGVAGEARLIDASFSIVATPAAALSVVQRVPHCDAFTADRIALVHYLLPEGGDGTAFFRHRATGFETVNETRRAAYAAALDAELAEALLYRSWNLHSGAIVPGAVLSADPRDDRLTVTAFLSIV